MNALHAVHRQRITLAVRAAQERGVDVRFSLHVDDERAYVAWLLCGLRYVIAAGPEPQMRALLPHVQREFREQLRAEANKVFGEAVAG